MYSLSINTGHCRKNFLDELSGEMQFLFTLGHLRANLCVKVLLRVALLIYLWPHSVFKCHFTEF